MLEQVPAGTRIARVMPNTPCVVSEMAAGYCVAAAASLADAEVTLASDRAVVHTLLSSCGMAVETEERLMDAVTGVSGSGPVRPRC
jgi:pyrroline-5-carboxylate reductase